MKILYQLSMILLGILLITGCEQKIERYDEYVFGVQLEDDPVKIQDYLEYHNQIWPEVEEGFERAGYQNIRLYHYKNYVSMIVQVPKGTDLDKIGASKELNTEKMNEWNALMASYQKGLPGTKEGTTWVRMEKLYEFNNDQ